MFALNPDSLIGSRIDQFRVDEFIARGAMGLVFKAFDTVLERTVALKLILKTVDPHAPEETEARRRFIQEAKATARVSDHPNIVMVYSFGETEAFQYICMEYISGKSLAKILSTETKVRVEKVLPIFEQILSGIQAAHQEGITHRDIKPSNIMITEKGQVRVVDFGIAKVASFSLTATGSVLGTPYYMSPEQISGRKIDGRSDLYSIGAVLYQVLTGERPYTAESTTALFYKILNDEPISPNIIDPSIPEHLCCIIRKAMAKIPDDRYQTPAEMLQAIRGVMQNTGKGTSAYQDAGAHQPDEIALPREDGDSPWKEASGDWPTAAATIKDTTLDRFQSAGQSAPFRAAASLGPESARQQAVGQIPFLDDDTSPIPSCPEEVDTKAKDSLVSSSGESREESFRKPHLSISPHNALKRGSEDGIQVPATDSVSFHASITEDAAWTRKDSRGKWVLFLMIVCLLFACVSVFFFVLSRDSEQTTAKMDHPSVTTVLPQPEPAPVEQTDVPSPVSATLPPVVAPASVERMDRPGAAILLPGPESVDSVPAEKADVPGPVSTTLPHTAAPAQAKPPGKPLVKPAARYQILKEKYAPEAGPSQSDEAQATAPKVSPGSQLKILKDQYQ